MTTSTESDRILKAQEMGGPAFSLPWASFAEFFQARVGDPQSTDRTCLSFHDDDRGEMARRLQGRPEAGRHDHGRRPENKYHRPAADAAADAGRAGRDAAPGDAGRAAAEEVRDQPPAVPIRNMF